MGWAGLLTGSSDRISRYSVSQNYERQGPLRAPFRGYSARRRAIGRHRPSYGMIDRLLTIRNASLVPVFSLVLLLLAAWPAEAAEFDDTIALCVSCHGEKGMPVEPDMPILWGQEFYYLYVQLKDYKAERRFSEFMNDVVAEMSRAEMKAVAQYFSEKPWPPSGFRSSTSRCSAILNSCCLSGHMNGASDS